MTAVMDLLLLLLAAPTLLVCLYLLLATLLSGRPVPALAPGPAALRQRRFDVIVPAHDEAAVIGQVVASLRRMAWPTECVRPAWARTYGVEVPCGSTDLDSS
jgi:hypothetical protein